VAVIGNPNAGKTTLFNRLTGLSQRVGNYPGVTVERKAGFSKLHGEAVRFLDLPGTYSLAALSPDEMVAVDVLLGHQEGETRPDLVLLVVDASNLERNLYLFSQVRELGVPMVVALNMVDIAARRAIRVDAAALGRALGVPVIPTEAHRGRGLDDLRQAIHEALDRAPNAESDPDRRDGAPLEGAFHDTIHEEAGRLFARVRGAFREASGRDLHPFEILRAVVDRGGHAEARLRQVVGASITEDLEAARRAIDGSVPLPALEAACRYQWIRARTSGCIERGRAAGVGWSERLDRVLTHRVLGLLIFAALMLLLFQSVFSWAAPLMGQVDALFAGTGRLVSSLLPEGALRSLLADGVVGGAGMVVTFLPQILILFFFIGLLEDSGYMARAAFLMDRFMSHCGLSGKSFIPMLSGFACAVPGIMATRVIENRRDRIATILVTPLMSCSARLPVYAVFIGTFIPNEPVVPGLLGLQALTLFALYLLGMVTAVAVAWTLKKTLLRGPTPPFVLELPTYKWPSPRGVILRLCDRAMAFLARAGTIILAVAVVVWALSYFPRPDAIAERFALERAAAERALLSTADGAAGQTAIDEILVEIDRREAGEYLRQSYFGRLGHAVEPCFEPLGWDWRISMAAIAAFPAREVLVSTLGTIFNLGSEVDEESTDLRRSLREATWDRDGRGNGNKAGAPLFTIPVSLSILVFFALCCQCGATVATIRRETSSWRWAGFAFGYMTVLAYLGSLATYQLAARLL
jgi:ferrous iron transport protein B